MIGHGDRRPAWNVWWESGRRPASSAGGTAAHRAVPLAYAVRLLDEARIELRNADVKASHGLVASGALAVVCTAPITSGVWHPAAPDQVQSWFWWLGCLLWVVSTGAFGAVLYPRLGVTAGGYVSYFGDVPRLGEDLWQLVAALDRTARRPSVAVMAELLWTSQAAVRKYRLVRTGIRCFALASITLSLAFL